MQNLEGSERLVNIFEKEWQERYDAAEAQALARRRDERIQAQASRDRPLEQAQHLNRVDVSAATGGCVVPKTNKRTQANLAAKIAPYWALLQ